MRALALPLLAAAATLTLPGHAAASACQDGPLPVPPPAPAAGYAACLLDYEESEAPGQHDIHYTLASAGVDTSAAGASAVAEQGSFLRTGPNGYRAHNEWTRVIVRGHVDAVRFGLQVSDASYVVNSNGHTTSSRDAHVTVDAAGVAVSVGQRSIEGGPCVFYQVLDDIPCGPVPFVPLVPLLPPPPL